MRRQLTDFFPELANPETREEKRDDVVYVFTRRIGTKGRRALGVVAILRRVPAKHLRVFELVAKLVDGSGELDVDAAAARQPEINLAISEAEAYAGATRRAMEALRELQPR